MEMSPMPVWLTWAYGTAQFVVNYDDIEQVVIRKR